MKALASKGRTTPPIRALLVDDHPMVREGLRAMLRGTSIKVVGEAGTGEAALTRASEVKPDIVLLDMKLPDLDGLVVLRRLKEIVPDMAILVVSMHDDPGLIRRAVEAGAAGYVLKGVSRSELLASVRAVRAGDPILPPALLRAILLDSRDPRTARSPRDDVPGDRLSPVELDVLRLLASGATNKEVGKRLRWSVGTVKKYVHRILEKLEVSDRTQAAVTAVRLGLLR